MNSQEISSGDLVDIARQLKRQLIVKASNLKSHISMLPTVILKNRVFVLFRSLSDIR